MRRIKMDRNEFDKADGIYNKLFQNNYAAIDYNEVIEKRETETL
jgi:hypothetical protein